MALREGGRGQPAGIGGGIGCLMNTLSDIFHSPWFWGAFAGVILVGCALVARSTELIATRQQRPVDVQLEESERLQLRSAGLLARQEAVISRALKPGAGHAKEGAHKAAAGDGLH